MGIVKISDELHQEIRKASTMMMRSTNAQVEFWTKIGLLAELNPNLTYHELMQKLLRTQADSLQALMNE